MSNSKKLITRAIPADWEVKKIKDVCDIIGGGTPSRSKMEYYESGTIPWIKTGELNQKYILDAKERITEIALQESSARLIPENSVLIAMYGATTGRISITKIEVATNQACCAMISKGEFDPEFLYYSLTLNKKKIIAMGIGGAQLNISQQVIRDLEIPFPSQGEQYKISSILSSVDEVIANTESIIEQVEKVKRGLMEQLFTKGFGHKKFKRTNMGEIPWEWEVLSFNDVLSFIGSGITPKGGSNVYQLEGISFIRSQNVYSDGLRLDNLVFISDVIHEKMRRSKVQEHDVLLNITGASIGRCAYVPSGFGEANVNQHVCILRSNGKVHYKFFSYFINSLLGQRQISSKQNGQTREGLNYQQIRAFKIPVPPMAEQEKISNIIESFNQKANNERKKLNTLLYLRNGLMQRLLTGEIRVKFDKDEMT
ncbi:hypothetical protein C1N83_00155 [Priestia aryabhattai]